jgi:hypothetical protein
MLSKTLLWIADWTCDRLKERHFFKISNTTNYGKAQHQGDPFCLFLIDCLLCFDEIFLHSQESKVRVAGSIVHCPWRVCGKGHYNDPFATVTTNNLSTCGRSTTWDPSRLITLQRPHLSSFNAKPMIERQFHRWIRYCRAGCVR